MRQDTIRTICFSICILCIVAGLVLGLGIIWNWIDNSALIRKSFLTLGVLFLASLLTLSVARKLGFKDGEETPKS
jgi:hypothetical protein